MSLKFIIGRDFAHPLRLRKIVISLVDEKGDIYDQRRVLGCRLGLVWRVKRKMKKMAALHQLMALAVK